LIIHPKISNVKEKSNIFDKIKHILRIKIQSFVLNIQKNIFSLFYPIFKKAG